MQVDAAFQIDNVMVRLSVLDSPSFSVGSPRWSDNYPSGMPVGRRMDSHIMQIAFVFQARLFKGFLRPSLLSAPSLSLYLSLSLSPSHFLEQISAPR